MKKFFVFITVFLSVISPVLGAEIQGYIYDFSLNKIGNVVVEIDTAPKQFYVSKDGAYMFTVPVGTYEVKAQHYDRGLLISSTSENLTVTDSGEYTLDLVLFPVINEEELIEDEVKISEDKMNLMMLMMLIIVAIIVIISLFIYYNKILKNNTKEKEEPSQTFKHEEEVKEQYSLFINEEREKEVEEIKPEHETKKEKKSEYEGSEILDKIIEIIKEEGGRTTQKNIRKKIPMSEAKISLGVTELEEAGKIKKIKKGRGNIIILR